MGSWDRSPELQARLRTAVGRTVAPVVFVYAANDFTLAPAKELAAEMARLGKPHSVKLYPAVGKTPAQGHDFYYLGLSVWERDVFPFLDARMRGSSKASMIRQ